MKKRAKYTLLSIGLLLLLICVPLFILPTSYQLVLAGVSGCEFTDKQLSEVDSDTPDIWEYPLMRIYRAKYLYISSPLEFEDSLLGKTTALHSLLAAYDIYKGDCEENILPLIDVFLERGANVNKYSDSGYTPLHEAIIFNHPKLVEKFLNSGGKTNVRVQSDNPKVTGLTAKELAEVLSRNNNNIERKKILSMFTESRS